MYIHINLKSRKIDLTNFMKRKQFVTLHYMFVEIVDFEIVDNTRKVVSYFIEFPKSTLFARPLNN